LRHAATFIAATFIAATFIAATVHRCNGAAAQRCRAATLPRCNVHRCNGASLQRCRAATVPRCNVAAAQVVDEHQALRVIATIDSPAEAAQARCIAVQRSPMQRAVN
jgi:hypothetical protein